MVIVIESQGIAAVQAAAVLAATLASVGLQPQVQVVSLTCAQALTLRKLSKELGIQVVGAAGARAATVASPRIVAGRLGAGPTAEGYRIVRLTCREDACNAAEANGWTFTYEGPDRATVHCPTPLRPHAHGSFATDPGAMAFAADVVRRHAMGALARRAALPCAPGPDVTGFVTLGHAALAVLNGLQVRTVVPPHVPPADSAPRRPRRRLVTSIGLRPHDGEARRDRA